MIKLTSSNLTKNLAKRTKLVQHLDAAFSTFDEELEFKYESKEKDNAFHPSGDCTPSVVDLYSKACSIIDGDATFDPISGSLRKTFLVGHFWHAVLQHILVSKLEFAEPSAIERKGHTVWGRTGNSFDSSSVPSAFHWATGAADVAPCTIPKHGDFLVDFKTMNGVDFSRNSPPQWAVGKWECQLNIYMDWFDLDRSLLIGIQKDSPHEFREWEFRRNQPLIDAIYRKWEIVSICLDEDDVPHIDEDIQLPLQGVVES